ncbi:hypothetical protein D0T50_00835 [Bacteroides sp. 214]|uniref:hypothetical protein n=1 Tax=Bacteroides sp. 214 TaxID=2302935 RepID=UPI0013D50AFD|nr:hypothetical protein [Bacteroides sp. 214]NDW11433.1 hypothetical protein [Bacteroides sp. 214]
MKFLKIALAILFVGLLCSSFSLKKKTDKVVYAFGVSSSFADSVVYYTEIQVLDSVTLDKHGFLPEMQMYSYQLKNYLEYQRGLKNRTCMIYYGKNKQKLAKEQTKVLSKIKKKNNVLFQEIKNSDFIFTKPQE